MTARVLTDMIVEVLRRDTTAAAMVASATEAFGEMPWTNAQRAVFAFRHDWSEPLIERLQWSTAVTRTASGHEFRHPIRFVPRRYLTYQVGNARLGDALVADWLADNLGKPAWFPLPQFAVRLASSVPAGAMALPVSQADQNWFAPIVNRPFLYPDSNGLGRTYWNKGQSFVLLLAEDGWQVFSLSAISQNLLWLAAPLARAVSAGAAVIPVVRGVVTDSAELVLNLPGAADGSVTAQIAFEIREEEVYDDPLLDGLPVWPDANWRDDPAVQAHASVTVQDLSPADPWVRRDDPWPASVFRRRYLAAGRENIERWRARLYRAKGRYGAFWLPDGIAPVLRVTHAASQSDGYLRFAGQGLSAYWHRPGGALIVHPDGALQHVLISTCHQDNGGVLVLGSELSASVPEGSRIVRLARCRLDHDTVDLYWHTPELVEIPLTMRQF